MSDLIDLKSNLVNSVLHLLLKDRTTGKNIIFATDAYDGINFKEHIVKKRFFSGTVDICPRVSKSIEEQALRTRKKAEVFTPSWICNKMNNYCDTEWFGREHVFNTEKDHEWISTEEKIEFPKEKSWKDYIDFKLLEITCGEAPYLVSRYDASTGELIPIKRRIGILDRKLRVVNENTYTRKTWNQWVYRAFESVYGYEYQGDNLLIARINLLETFCEYTLDRWNEEPTESALKRIADIVSRNLWQMDGIHGVIPYTGAVCEQKEENEHHQMSLFEIMEIDDECEAEKEETLPETIDCKIYDWQENKSITYKSMKEDKAMKFDFVIGNPPFQEESEGDKKADKSIYNYFIDEAYKVGEKIELITPARFLFDTGNTPKNWRRKMLSDEHFKVLVYEDDATKIFPITDIRGVAVHYKDNSVNFGTIEKFTIFAELNSILKKVLKKKEDSITTIIYNQNKFNLPILYK